MSSTKFSGGGRGYSMHLFLIPIPIAYLCAACSQWCCVVLDACVPETAGRCQGQQEREFYRFNLKVRVVSLCVHLHVCLCEGGQKEIKEETFSFLL